MIEVFIVTFQYIFKLKTQLINFYFIYYYIFLENLKNYTVVNFLQTFQNQNL